MRWPRYPTTVVGSWPRPEALLRAMKRRSPDLAALRDTATRAAIRAQEDAGLDLVTDGEQRRDNFYSFLAERLEGTRLMSMADLLPHVEDKAGFEQLLTTLDVPAYAIKNPTVVGKLRRARPLVADDARFLRAHTSRPIKVTLPGPYLLSRSMWVQGLSAGAYPGRAALIDDLVAILREELAELLTLDVAFIQLDEPVLTELVFAGKSETHTFMCAALAANASPEEELALAVDVVNRVVDGFDRPGGPILGLHVCRGNWSREDDVLLAGDYDPLVPTLARMRVGQFVLEYATPRAGRLDVLAGLPARAQLGLGCVNPRTAEVETPEAVARKAREAAAVLGPERIFLNPDCGFGTFAERPVNDAATAARKLAAMVAAAKMLRA